MRGKHSNGFIEPQHCNGFLTTANHMLQKTIEFCGLRIVKSFEWLYRTTTLQWFSNQSQSYASKSD